MVSSVGRALALQARGHRFEPGTIHMRRGVAQLGSAPDSGSGCRGFESRCSDMGECGNHS